MSDEISPAPDVVPPEPSPALAPVADTNFTTLHNSLHRIEGKIDAATAAVAEIQVAADALAAEVASIKASVQTPPLTSRI